MGLRDIADLNKSMFKDEIRRIITAYQRLGMDKEEIRESLNETSEDVNRNGIDNFVSDQ